MLFPLGDDNSMRRSVPVVTWTLIAINILVFLYQLSSDAFTYGYSVVPFEIVNGKDLVSPAVINQRGQMIEAPNFPGPTPIYLTLFSAMFMHGDWLHIGGNMLYLWIFGDNVEDNMGRVKFIIFYLLCGLLASATHIFFDPNSTVPSLGASGAIAGVLGAYLVLYPHGQVRVLVPLGFFSQITYLPALIVIGLWGLLQFIGGFGSIGGKSQGGVAYMAHVGGFVAGLALVFLFRDYNRLREDRAARSWHEQGY
ncbi:MAG TPA: rhomboid family intramembrane serine protease [Blastocatellia bacterium]|nr:rhomboid family intramembrane serine protease [Blastocatellia bacterium]